MPSSRILAVDDDAELLALLAATLTRDGFRVTTVGSAEEALERGTSTSFDLVVSDVDLPHMSGLELRDQWHKRSGYEDTPFLFVSGLAPKIETELARKLGRDRLVPKPFTRAELRRAVYGALKLSRVTVGPISATLDKILAECADQQGTGVLAAVSGAVAKRVVILEGKAVFAFSNDRRDLIGQAFLRAGLVSEADLLEAFSLWNSRPQARGTPFLGTALSALKKVTPEQSRAVFEKKIREAILDLFLWDDGMVEFVEGEIADDEHPFPIALDVATLRTDGRRRRAHWREANKLVPDRTVAFTPGEAAFPSGFPGTAGDKQLIRCISRGLSMSDILVEFRGQDYAIVMRVADLVRRGCLEPRPAQGFAAPVTDTPGEGARYDVAESVDALFADLGTELGTTGAAVEPERAREASTSEAPMIATLNDALIKLRTGDLRGARTGLLLVLSADPFNTLARERLEEVEQSITDAARGGGLGNEDRVRLGVPAYTLTGAELPANDAFVLSRLSSGPFTVGDLVYICPFPEREVLEILVRRLGDGTLTRDDE